MNSSTIAKHPHMKGWLQAGALHVLQPFHAAVSEPFLIARFLVSISMSARFACGVIKQDKNYPRTTQMDTKDAPDDWLQYALKIQSRINFWPSYGDF